MSGSDQLSILKREINRLGFVSGEKISLLAHVTENVEKIAVAVSCLDDFDEDEDKRTYLRSLISKSEQPVSEPSNKRARIENEYLTRFWDAAATGADIPDDVDILKLPDGVHFLGEFDEPSILLIRKCYRHLLALVLDNNSRIRNLIITGNPGIGKTYFGYYLIYVLIRRNQIVVYETHSRKYVIVFDQQRAFKLYEAQDVEKYLSNPNNWYIVDGKKPDKVSARTILVCSPKKDYYAEFEKFPFSSTRYMTVWSYAEICMCKEKIYSELDDNLVKTLFDHWGGIPRFVLEKATDFTHQSKLQEAIVTCKFSILNYIGATDADDTSHKLIHLTTNTLIEDVRNEQEPNIDGGNDVESVEEVPPYSQKLIKFASDYVAERVIEQLESVEKGKLRRELYSNLSESRSNPVLGRYFEEIAHQLLRGGGTFNIRSLEPDGGESRTKTFIKQDSILTFSEISSISDGNYYRPDNPNYPSIDSIIAPNELYQMTTTMYHPIKMVGLKRTYEKLAERGEISYYFVVPSQLYNDYKKQKFVPVSARNDENQGAQSAQNMPPWIRRRVKQYALKIDLSPETSTSLTDTQNVTESSSSESERGTESGTGRGTGRGTGSGTESETERGPGRRPGRGPGAERGTGKRKRGRPRKIS